MGRGHGLGRRPAPPQHREADHGAPENYQGVRAKRSPVKAIRAVAAVARWQRYTDPETKQDYLYDEASGQSKWADGSAEVWTANPRLANVAREIMRRRRRSKDAAFAAAAGAVADERLGREAAERRLRRTEKGTRHARLQAEGRPRGDGRRGPAADGSGLRGLRGGLRAVEAGADAGADDAGAVRREKAPRELWKAQDRRREDQAGDDR